MDNVCYVLGAGFSAYAGLPVMANFIDKAKDLYFSTVDNEYKGEIKKTLESIKQYAIIKEYMESNLSNIEELLSITDMKSFTSNVGINRNIKAFIKGVIQYYENIFMSNLILKPQSISLEVFSSTIADQYLAFVLSVNQLRAKIERTSIRVKENDKIFDLNLERIKSENRYDIISLNYDTVLENILSKVSERCAESKSIGFSRTNIDNDCVRYCKLHGSIDTNTIIPPTWAKVLQKDIKKDWIDAHTIIKNANHIRIIGFSFPNTDSHISYLFKSAIIENDNLKKIDIICLDDRQGSIKEKYSKMFCTSKIRFIDGNVGDYFKMIIKMSRTPEGIRDCSSSLERAHEAFFDNHS